MIETSFGKRRDMLLLYSHGNHREPVHYRMLLSTGADVDLMIEVLVIFDPR